MGKVVILVANVMAQKRHKKSQTTKKIYVCIHTHIFIHGVQLFQKVFFGICIMHMYNWKIKQICITIRCHNILEDQHMTNSAGYRQANQVILCYNSIQFKNLPIFFRPWFFMKLFIYLALIIFFRFEKQFFWITFAILQWNCVR